MAHTALPGRRPVTPGVGGLRRMGPGDLYLFPTMKPERDMLTLGRAKGRDIRIQHPTVSELHAVVEKTRQGGFVLIDRDSTNGIEVARRGNYSSFRKVEYAYLELGNYIRLGGITLAVSDRAGNCAIWAATEDEFLRTAIEIYGSREEAFRRVGCEEEAERKQNKAAAAIGRARATFMRARQRKRK